MRFGAAGVYIVSMPPGTPRFTDNQLRRLRTEYYSGAKSANQLCEEHGLKHPQLYNYVNLRTLRVVIPDVAERRAREAFAARRRAALEAELAPLLEQSVIVSYVQPVGCPLLAPVPARIPPGMTVDAFLLEHNLHNRPYNAKPVEACPAPGAPADRTSPEPSPETTPAPSAGG